jgi:hypothetical protein
MAMVPDSECRTPTLIVSAANAAPDIALKANTLAAVFFRKVIVSLQTERAGILAFYRRHYYVDPATFVANRVAAASRSNSFGRHTPIFTGITKKIALSVAPEVLPDRMIGNCGTP